MSETLTPEGHVDEVGCWCGPTVHPVSGLGHTLTGTAPVDRPAGTGQDLSGEDKRLAEAAAALLAIGKACIVVAPTLRQPYLDDPSQNPWDRFVQEPARRAYNLGCELRRELKARGVEVPR